MPKYLLLKHYTGGPERHPDFVPMSEWTEDEITAHMAFQRHVAELLRKRGEFADVQALSPEGTYVRYGGPGMAPVATDGPFPAVGEQGPETVGKAAVSVFAVADCWPLNQSCAEWVQLGWLSRKARVAAASSGELKML
jgi:hypothetical protein